MQKIKFSIQGMDCDSCASLIEEKLKQSPGILEVKVNYDSQKGVVVYDENKIDRDQINQIINKAGDFKIQDSAETIPTVERSESATQNVYPSSTPPGKSHPISKVLMFLKVLTVLSVLSLILNFILINKIGKTDQAQSKEQEKVGIVQGQGPVAPQPQPTQPAPQPTNEKPSIQTIKVTKDDHVRGDFNAPITLVEFSDFECPFCARHYPTLNKILDNYAGKVRLVYKYFPLSFHPNSQKAAESAECASDQGKFWQYHDQLFENLQTGFSVANFKKWAKDLGLNEEQFNSCLDSGKYAQKVKDDLSEGTTLGVNGTPATFVNGQLISGALPYESFTQIIDGLLNEQ